MSTKDTVRIGLALSGGGYRATGFHLGVFRKLLEMGLLDKVTAISCVSGGAIAGAYLAAAWTDTTAIDRLEVFLTSESLFKDSVVGSILNPFKTRTEKLAEALDDKLYRKKTLRDLANGPRIFLNATNVGTGHLFSFSGGANGECGIGEYELGYIQKPDFSLAKAVAASSAIPLGFAPLRIEPTEYRLPPPYKYTALVDGGVYDNLGINPLLRKGAGIDVLIVSDAGYPYEYEAEPTESGVLVVRNTIDIMMEQLRTMQFERLISRWNANTGPRPLWFSIDSESSAQTPGDAKRAAAIPTGFNKLGINDLAVLERHGAALVGDRILRYAPGLARAGDT